MGEGYDFVRSGEDDIVVADDGAASDGTDADLRFAAQNGSKLYQGLLKDFTDEEVVLQPAEGELLSFPRKAVAIVKPVIDFDEDDLPDDGGEVLDGDFSEMEFE